MSYETVVAQVKTVPEECLDEISTFIGYVLYRYKQNDENSQAQSAGLSEFFGAMKITQDPLKIQEELRNEWN